MLLSVIIPAYNEAGTLLVNIEMFLAYLRSQFFDYEIIIINDGSTDATPQITAKLAEENPRLRLINFTINQGKGAALRAGLLAAQGDYHLYLDADGATSIDHLELALGAIRAGAPLIIGTRNWRDVPGAVQVLPQALWKRLLGQAGNLLIQLFLIRGIWDTQCGFKILGRATTRRIIPLTKSRRWGLDFEIIALAQALSIPIVKIPVAWQNGRTSRVRLRDYFITLRELIRIKYYLLAKKYPLS